MIRCRRSRDELNRALHEIRRPLQALALVAGPDVEPQRHGLLELAAAALTDLDRVVNGGDPSSGQPRHFACRELVRSALERWDGVGASAGQMELRWQMGPALVEGEPLRVAQALDNMITNAIEHGSSPVVVTGERVRGMVRITVSNRCDARHDGDHWGPGSSISEARTAGARHDPRHGHGLRIASSVATAHGGRFLVNRTGTAVVAALELPLATPERPIASARIARAA